MNFDEIIWDMNGREIEDESFRRVENEIDLYRFDGKRRYVVRRLIHTTADFAIADLIKFNGDPFEACLKALRRGVPIFSDSNMIKSGVSVAKLRKINPDYSRDSVRCFIADRDVAEIAAERNITRALAAVEKAEPILDGSIVLIGNAPLALAGIVRLAVEKGIRPALVIGMPVGFVNVVEAKKLLSQTDIPHVTIEGRRGGSTLAVAALHAILEPALIEIEHPRMD
ncbi:MAG: precorrin-8X methylmutase [Kiritimatiellaeota bacterium]|nr:precorrin-8X methylmutase [Kiritimatiellota bacterium]